ncbi:TIGR03767 family metallophosphoesterase [Calidifontibacter indicus]|uniref:TIGR03767 family metallophosphoesterase n=1 Tax=Calidifontibacter indicus TaxID=419650 RepID=UPI003D75EBC0
MVSINRRTVLLGGVAGLGSAALVGTDSALAQANAKTANRAFATRGTTLEQAAAPRSASGYTRLVAGAGYPLVVREELCAAKPRRDDTRTALASVVQFTDLHMIDAQSPVRFEWLHDVTGSAFRPQEALGTQGAAQLVQRINTLATGPFSGRPFDCVVSTGDNTDNHEGIELEWFLRVMSGGRITPNTGATGRWEGVQTGGDDNYYLVESSAADRYKKAGFPTIPGYFARATATHTSTGLKTKWFSVFGNHDDSIEGALPSGFPVLNSMYTGNVKFNGFASASDNTALRAALATGSTAIRNAAGTQQSSWIVTPDERRAPFTTRQFMAAHLEAQYAGPGPVGHGFTPASVADDIGYYSFPIAPGVTGIAMDSTNRAGFTEGSIGHAQWTWIQATLQAGSSRYIDPLGREVRRTGVSDELFVLFSHHTSGSMSNLLLDPALPFDMRHAGFEVVSMIKRYPNVIAWVNGHTHANKITPQHHSDPTRSFWEINTASHIDFPQHARIIDVCDNKDGSLSLFTTLVESAAPYQASYTDGSQAALASVYRELSYNDLHRDLSQLGTGADRNTELLLKNPLA